MRIFKRILILPFIICISTISTFFQLIKYNYDFLISGGEIVVYDKDVNISTIREMFMKLKALQYEPRND